MTDIFDRGDVIRCAVVFENTAGTAIDPTTVLFKIKTPTGTTTSYTYLVDAALIKTSVGNYYVDVDVGDTNDSEGTWAWRWYSTGTGKAADEGKFLIRDSNF